MSANYAPTSAKDKKGEKRRGERSGEGRRREERRVVGGECRLYAVLGQCCIVHMGVRACVPVLVEIGSTQTWFTGYLDHQHHHHCNRRAPQARIQHDNPEDCGEAIGLAAVAWSAILLLGDSDTIGV